MSLLVAYSFFAKMAGFLENAKFNNKNLKRVTGSYIIGEAIIGRWLIECAGGLVSKTFPSFRNVTGQSNFSF